MDVVSVGPFKAGSLRWQARPGAWVLTVACKATFRLSPGDLALTDEQEHLNDDDGYWDDDPRKSLCFAGDLVPYKARADVLLTGSAYAPGGRPAAAVHARLVVGEIDKLVAVHADRCFTLDGSLRDGAHFTKMPLRWERAAGGPGTSNPVGVDPNIASEAGEVLLPNLVPAGFVPQRPREVIEPVCFAPIAPTWPARRAKLGALAGRFALRHIADAVLPREIEPGFFQVAPADQRPATLAEDAQIVLEGLHPHHPRLLSRLPGVKARAIVDRRGGAQDLPLRADTLAIDTDRGIVTLMWRGQVPLISKDEAGRVIVTMEGRRSQRSWPEVAKLLHAVGAMAEVPSVPDADTASDIESLSDDDVRPAEDTMAPGLERHDQATETLLLIDAPAGQTMPFAQGAPVLDRLRRAEQAAAEGRGGALPARWGPALPAAFQAQLAPQVQPRTGDQHITDMLPAALPAPVMEAPPPPPVPPMPPPPAISAPAMLPPPPTATPAMPPPRPMIGGRPAFMGVAEPLPPAPPKPAEVAIAPALAMATGGAADAVRLGVAGLSNAAAGAQRVLARREEELAAPRAGGEKVAEKGEIETKRAASEAFDLLWHAPELAKKLRRDLGWRRLFLESDLDPPAENELEVMSEEDAETPEEADRRRIADALARGAPAGMAALREAVRKGVRSSGRFEAPLLLLEGELEVTFDEVETLRAVTAAAAPLGGLDKRVKEAVDAAHEALRSAWIAGAGAVAEGYADRIREAFAAMRREAGAGRRPIAADYLDATAGRALSMGRHYAKRQVYGVPHARGALRLGGEERVVVYLTEEAARRLPIAARPRARVLAEVGMRVDVGEASRWAGRVLAVGVAMGVES